MSCYVKKSETAEVKSGHGHGSWPMLGEAQGCVNKCCAGISYYSSTEYTPPAVHDDQEGVLRFGGPGLGPHRRRGI